MEYTEQLPVMNAVGVEPPQSLKDSGWGGGDYPAAGHFNWFLHRAYKVLQELQQESATTEWVTQQMAEINIALIDSYTSNDKTKAPTADALRAGLETKQNVMRLADNYLAASVLVNAAPDGSGRSYPDGVSMFKVSTSAGGWPTANGYVLTFRAGSGGYQTFYEMYTGATQTDKTARQWTRSKRDSNAFWQSWAQVMTEVDRDAILGDYIRQPGYAATTGTGAAYTVSLNPVPATLPDGFGITIVPHVANTAVDPTLQIGSLAALPIRRQNGATFAAGTIKAGAPLALIKVGSYFLARSVGATGTATAAQVRAGATFSNESNVDLVGTLQVQATAAQTITPGTTDQVKPAGIYDGTITFKGDANLVGANILSGKTIFGVSGSANADKSGSIDVYSAAQNMTAGQTVTLVNVPSGINNGLLMCSNRLQDIPDFLTSISAPSTISLRVVQGATAVLINRDTSTRQKLLSIKNGAVRIMGSSSGVWSETPLTGIDLSSPFSIQLLALTNSAYYQPTFSCLFA